MNVLAIYHHLQEKRMSKDWEWVPDKKEDEAFEYKNSIWAKTDKEPIYDNPCYAVFNDKYPCTEGHLLYVPKTKDAPGMIGLCFQEAYRDGMEKVKEGKIDGFNIGMNHGGCAGQTVFWPHVHFIPRKNGDQEPGARGIRIVYPTDPFNPNKKKEL